MYVKESSFLFLVILMLFLGLTIIIREAHAQMSFLDLLQEDILLVEKEHNGGGGKVTVVTDAVEQVETLMHSVLWLKVQDKQGFCY